MGPTSLAATLDDAEVLHAGALDSDGIIHLAYEHALGQVGGAQSDAGAIETFAAALAGLRQAHRGLRCDLVRPGRRATERDELIAEGPITARIANMRTALASSERGVRSSLVMLPRSVHGQAERHGFNPQLIARARTTGVSGYIGDGRSRWPAVHVKDATTLFRRAVEQAPSGAMRNAVGDEGVAVRQIAEAIGVHLNLPARSLPAEDFGAPLTRCSASTCPPRAPPRRSSSTGRPPTRPSSRTSSRATTSYERQAGLSESEEGFAPQTAQRLWPKR